MPSRSAMRRTTGVMTGAGPSSTWASPGLAAASISARTVPTSTVTPGSTRSSATRPVAGDGTSTSTLSVDTSQIGSSASIQSPGRLRHSMIVPSATETPIWGMVTSTVVACGSVSEELTAGLLHVVDLGQDRPFERRAERHRGVGRAHAHDRAVEVLERLLGDERRDLGHHAAGAAGLLEQ